VSDLDYLKKIAVSSEGTEEDEEDDPLKDDISNWDIFDDFNKF
jgi:hypothetical protein